MELVRIERLTQTAKELSETTGQECIPTPADVRQPATLKEAVAKTIAKFGHIDYVICGKYSYFINCNIPTKDLSTLKTFSYQVLLEISWHLSLECQRTLSKRYWKLTL